MSGSYFLRNIDCLLNLQGNAHPSEKNTLILAAMYHPGNACPNVHDSGQVCMVQGKNGRDFRAFTTRILVVKAINLMLGCTVVTTRM
jgi:hypothetical protein